MLGVTESDTKYEKRNENLDVDTMNKNLADTRLGTLGTQD